MFPRDVSNLNLDLCHIQFKFYDNTMISGFTTFPHISKDSNFFKKGGWGPSYILLIIDWKMMILNINVKNNVSPTGWHFDYMPTTTFCHLESYKSYQASTFYIHFLFILNNQDNWVLLIQ